MPPGVWSEYMRRQDPFQSRVKAEEYRTLFDECSHEGRDLACRRRIEWGTDGPVQILSELGVRVVSRECCDTDLPETAFAAFIEPDVVVWRRDVIGRAQQYMDQVIEPRSVDLRSLVLAHELFHVLAFQGYGETPLCHKCKVEVGGFGPVRIKRVLPSLEEVEAMGFACGLRNSDVVPYAFNVVLLMPISMRMAHEQFEAIMNIGRELEQRERDVPCALRS